MIKNVKKHNNNLSNSSFCCMYCTSGATDDVDLLPLQIRVAVLITSAPTGLLKENYFTLLSPQIIELIKFAIDSKDVSLQKICVLAIMRISHFRGDICDLYLVRPLTVALLNINNVNPHLSQSSNDQSVLISSSSTIQKSISSTESIHSVVNVLHVLLTICPTQQPLLASLERCEVIKPVLALAIFLLTSNRNSPLLTKLQDICRIIFSTSTNTEYIANQLHAVIVRTTCNIFCINTDGHLTIERRMKRISDTQTVSAADYALHLGLEGEGVGKILSPTELLSAKQAQLLKLSASAGVTLNESDGGREKEVENGRGDNMRAPGWEVDDILSMALIAASAEERNAASKRASLSIPLLSSSSQTPISNTSQSIYNLWDLGMHDSQENEDSNIEYGRGDDDDDDDSRGVTGPGSAHLMLEVSVRAKAAAELLLHTEQSVSNPQSNSKDNGNTDGKCNISKRNGLKVAVEGMGERDETETKITREGVAAELFMCCLKHFLTRPTTVPLHGQLQVQSDRPCTATADASSSHEDNELDRGLSGLVLVLLQAHVPMEILLKGG